MQLKFRRVPQLVALSTAALLALTACGDSAGSDPDPAAATTPAAESPADTAAPGTADDAPATGSPDGGSSESPTGSAESPAESTATGGAAEGLLDVQAATDQVTGLLGELPELTGETTRGVNGTVITIAGVGSNTKGGVQTVPGMDAGAEARFERANREGGVNGYTIDYAGFTDDHSNPAELQQAVQDAVDSKKAFAIVPYNPITGSAKDTLIANKVPTFGQFGTDLCTWTENPFSFGVAGQSLCTDPLPNTDVGVTSPLVAYMNGTGKSAADIKLAIFAHNQPVSAGLVAGWEAAAKGLGIETTYVKLSLPGPNEPALTDYSPVAQEMIGSGANLIWSGASAPGTLGVFGSLKSLGYDGELLGSAPSAAYLENPQTAATLDGTFAMTGGGGVAALDPDAFKQVQEDLDAIGSDAQADGYGTTTSYWAADLFLQALAQVEGDLTVEKLTNVLNGGEFAYEGLPGVTCDGQFPLNRVLQTLCVGLIKYDAANKAMVPVAKFEPVGDYAFVTSES